MTIHLGSVGDNQPLYISGVQTTIRGETFNIGNHAVLHFSDISEPVEGEITAIGNHTVDLNGTMYQLNNCISAQKIDLSGTGYALSRIETSKENLGDAFAYIQTLGIPDLILLLKTVNNKLEISRNKFNKINIPTLDGSSNTNSISELLKNKAEALEDVRIYEGIKLILSNRLDQLHVEKIKEDL